MFLCLPFLLDIKTLKSLRKEILFCLPFFAKTLLQTLYKMLRVYYLEHRNWLTLSIYTIFGVKVTSITNMEYSFSYEFAFYDQQLNKVILLIIQMERFHLRYSQIFKWLSCKHHLIWWSLTLYQALFWKLNMQLS